jgi:hypothetical protein
MKALQFLFTAAVSISFALTGCGGGGSAPSAGGTSSGAVPTITTMIPTPPALGATLIVDAAKLRPVRDAAVWSYRGISTAYSGATPVPYVTSTRQVVTTTGVTEFSTNSGNSGADSQPLSVAAGVVAATQSIDFAGKGTAQTVNFTELRSPVRQGDQYTILDQRYTDTDIDADRDGKPDALEVAIYARVMGSETLSLPNLPSMTAIRVDSTVLTRVTFSSNGQVTPVVQAGVQTWYVAGVGIVRQVATSPATTGTSFEATEEKLVSWDGGEVGLGAMVPVKAVIPAGNAIFPNGTLPGGQSELRALGFAKHVLLFGDTPGSPTSTLVSRLDLRGNLLGATLLPGLRVGSNGLFAGHLAGAVYLEPLAGGAVYEFGLTRVDSNGQLQGPVRGVTINLAGAHVSSYVTRFTGTVDGSTFWLLWSRSFYDPGGGRVPGDELILRPYSLEGLPLGPETVIDTVQTSNLNIAASNGKAVLTWVKETPDHSVMFASASLTNTPVVRTLVSGLSASNSFVTPLRLGGNSALVWPAQLGSGGVSASSFGVLVDPGLTLVTASNSTLSEQAIGLPPSVGGGLGPTSLGSRLVVTNTRYGLFHPDDANARNIDSVNWLDTNNSPLTTNSVTTVRTANGPAKSHVIYPDRVLVFGGADGLVTTLVWLNKGDTP